MSGTISRDECEILNDILGIKAPAGCNAMIHNSGKDAFTYPNDNPFVGEDAVKHRNSWLMPRLARRMTKNSPIHPSKWRQPVTVDAAQCAQLRKALEEQVGSAEAASKLPDACRK